MEIKNTAVNANENNIFLGAAYYDTDCFGRNHKYRLKYRDAVKFLIDKYWNSPYKALPQSRQYTFVELRLVTEFDLAESGYNPDPHPTWREIRQSQLNMIAHALEISPIILYNDQELPVYLRP